MTDTTPHMRAMRLHAEFLRDFHDLAAAGGLSKETLLGVQFCTQAALRHIEGQIATIEAHEDGRRQ